MIIFYGLCYQVVEKFCSSGVRTTNRDGPAGYRHERDRFVGQHTLTCFGVGTEKSSQNVSPERRVLIRDGSNAIARGRVAGKCEVGFVSCLRAFSKLSWRRTGLLAAERSVLNARPA